MMVGLVSAVIVMIVGSIYGAISGLIGGKVDIVMMRVVDIIYSVPEILLIVVIKMVISEPLQSSDRHGTYVSRTAEDRFRSDRHIHCIRMSVLGRYGQDRPRPDPSAEDTGLCYSGGGSWMRKSNHDHESIFFPTVSAS